jgi:hypothetical protein
VIVATSGFGYYVGMELQESSSKIKAILGGLETEIVACNEDLRKRVEKLESKLASSA